MISYSPNAAKAIGYLKRKFNQVEIFVEDTSCRIIWDSIIKRLLPKGTKIRSINRLGGRQNVIAACRLDQKNDGRRKIYIIDGDFDYANGLQKDRLKYLYRIRGYCIENLLVNKQLIEQIAEISDPNNISDEVRKNVNFNEWERSVHEKLAPLYISYATASQHYMRIKTVSYPIDKFIISKNGKVELCSKKIFSRVRYVYRDMMHTASISEITTVRRTIAKNVARINGRLYISGKDAILPMILFHLRATANFKGSSDQLKAHLASLFTEECEPFLARRLAKL
ncbi:DUF4435 domain-containing protein [Brevundimonas naejangsanensis]